MQQPTDSQTVTAHQQQHPADDLQQQEEAGGAQHGPGSSGSTGSSSQRKSWRQRVVAYSIRAIQAVLLLEVAAMLAQPLLAAGPQQLKETEAETDPADFDPCDILVDFFSGRRGITALQTLNNKQLRQAVDNMVTEVGGAANRCATDGLRKTADAGLARCCILPLPVCLTHTGLPGARCEGQGG